MHCLAKQMQRLGERVRVVTHASRNRTDWLRLSTIWPDPARQYQYDDVPVFQVGYSRACRLRMLPWMLSYYINMPTAVRHIAELISREMPAEWGGETPSLVHVSRIGREFLARAALNFARHRQIPFVLTPNHHPRWCGPLYREYDKIYREADAVVALTYAEKELFIREKRVREERIHVTGIGPVLSETFSAEAFRERFGIHGRFVLFLGQQHQYKGVGALLSAAPLVWKNHPDVEFVFIGPMSSYSRKRFSRLNDRRLINLGSLDLETKTSALAACELVCLPSVQESFGGVFVEAWSHRKPVVGGRIASIANVIDEGRDGLLASQSAPEVAAAINTLLSDSGMCEAMGNAGWEKVQVRYTWKVWVSRLCAFINRWAWIPNLP